MPRKQKKQKEDVAPEPDIPWAESWARILLEKDIQKEKVPLKAKDENGNFTIPRMGEIYEMRPEYAAYHRDKFSSRLSALRASVQGDNGKKGEIKEPKIQWKHSEAKNLMYEDLMNGNITLDVGDVKETKEELEEIYAMHIEYSLYRFSRFRRRLGDLRKAIIDCDTRAAEDKKDVFAYIKNNPASTYSHKGYIEWAGSEAQALLLEDIEEGLHTKIGKKELFGSRPAYYENFPLDVFRDKVYQEIRTAKYLHTCEILGKFKVAS